MMQNNILKIFAAFLKSHNLVFKINTRLVRGLDYYNRTVFEWVSSDLGSQGTIAGGGRYDYLVERIGGKPTVSMWVCNWNRKNNSYYLKI